MADLANPDLDWVYFVELHPYDRDAAAATSIYLATRDVFFDSADPDAPNREYNGIVDVALSLSRGIQIGGGSIKPDAQPSYGGLSVAVDDELWKDAVAGIPYWRKLIWDGYNMRILRGVVPRDGAPWRYADLTLIHGGATSGGNTWASPTSIPFGGFSERLRKVFAGDTYSGAGGFDGTSDLAGKTVQRALGVVRHATPILVDPENEWWDVAPLDGFHTFIGAFQGAFAYETTLTNPPSAGKLYVDMANGRVRTNGLPTLPFSVSFVSGFASGATTAADICHEVALDLGMDAGEIDDDTFDDLNDDNGEDVGLMVTSAATGVDIFDKLLGTVGAFHTEDNGKLQVFRFEPPDAATADDADLLITDDDLIKGELKPRPDIIPPSRIDLDYAPCWTKQDPGQVADAAAAADRTFVLNAWRTKSADAAHDDHKLAQPQRVETYFDEEAAAGAEVTRLAGMFAVEQEMLDAPIAAAPFGLKVGKTQVWVQSDFWGIDQVYRVVNIADLSKSGRVNLALWRPAA